MSEHVILLSIPGLRVRDIAEASTPTLHRWASQGALATLVPTFPCVTSPVQASMLTGTPPGEHGVIANGFYHRHRREVEFWVAQNDIIAGEQIWTAIRKKFPGFTSAVWHAQNIKGADADFIVTPAPIHEPDGTTKLWCYSKPEGLYQSLLDELGHFPLKHYWGPLANIESTRWILNAAGRLIEQHAPNFHWIYIPHLDYAAQKHGPDSPPVRAALAQLDAELAQFADRVAAGSLGDRVVYLVAGEYALTDVSGVVYPNRLLREAGLLSLREEEGSELIDLEASRAFAVVDHQLAHVYVRDADDRTVARVRDLFASVNGVAGVYAAGARAEVGLSHVRSGEVILVADDDHWFAYYWWLDDTAAPPFARTVDIHRKPGYDPVELFFDPSTKSIPLNASLVKGSHGVPATQKRHRAALICSGETAAMQTGETYRDTDLKRIVLELLSAGMGD
ncbi:MAG: alkaline phosphatase family protein [Planctomycetes bacterium]|nr:alkaline phosphatase family protein [Planctomycetota bacterium]